MNSLQSDSARFDGLVPSRKHRARLLFGDPDPAQREAEARYEPLFQFARVFVGDQDFAAHIQAIRTGSVSMDEVAKLYVRRAGYTRRVMAGVLEDVVCHGGSPAEAVLGLATVGVYRASGYGAAQWPHAKRRGEAAGMLAMLGAGRCCGFTFSATGKDLCRTKLTIDARARRYCDAHAPRPGAARSDREAVTELLTAMGAALRVS